MSSYPQIVNEFIELVKIETHSKQERLLADTLINKLQEMGLSVIEDKAGEKIGGNTGNLIARLQGEPDIEAIMFSAHLDRVDNHGHITPIINPVERVITSDGSSILAADDVSGICAILDGIRRAQAAGIKHGDIEVVFSVAEEIGLLGARYLDYSLLKSKMAFVMDAMGPLGTIINQGPTHYAIEVRVHGQSAHAGVEPEKGLSAIMVMAQALSRIPQGRLSTESTANFGIIKGGKAANIVCDLVEITGEARSTNNSELESYLDMLKKVFSESAKKYKTTIDVETSVEYETFKVDKAEDVIQIAVQAMKNLNLTPQVQKTGGGMDGNYFNANGIKSIGISPGYKAVHTPKEEQSIDLLIKSGELVFEIIKESAR